MKCLAYEGLFFFSLSNCELHLLVFSHVAPAPGTLSSLWHDARSCLYTSEQVPSFLISAEVSHPTHSCKAVPSSEGNCHLFNTIVVHGLFYTSVSQARYWVKIGDHLRSCMARLPCPAEVHGVAKSWTWLSDRTERQKSTQRCKAIILPLKKKKKSERIALKRVCYHMWTRLPVQVWRMRQGAWGWCTGMTLRDGMRREVGGWTPVAESCECTAKTTTIL